MFDLFDECGKEIKGKNYTVRKGFPYQISRAKFNIITKEQEKEFSLAKGTHYMFHAPLLHLAGQESEKYLAGLVASSLRNILKEKGFKKGDKILIACLGNPDIQADMLGKVVFDGTNNLCLQNSNIFKFCPNICLFTGIQSGEIIKLIVQSEKIALVVIVDCLTTTSLDRLGKTIQLVGGGITPGSGVHRFGKAINEEFLHAKCISVGASFMMSSRVFAPEKDEIFLCPKDVEENVRRVGQIISAVLEKVLL